MAVTFKKQFLLVATDKSRIIMFATNSGHQLRNFYGAVNDLYDIYVNLPCDHH
jgi:hypothetical protein